MKIQSLRVIALAFLLTATAAAQNLIAPSAVTGHITGTVTDDSGDTLSGAKVVLQGSGPADHKEILSDDNGFFDFSHLGAGTYHVSVSGQGFSNWTSAELALNPGQYMILSECKLRVATVATTVNVAYRPQEIATEQVQVEEQQRVLGVIPNFYVVYDPNPVPLTTRLKFRLALKTSTDVFTVLGVGTFAAINQAGDTPNYPQGAKGYGERFGAAGADGFSDIMIGGAILPSLLHQDPRYYYKGSGSTRSRVFHAISSPFVCRGDNGKLQPNFSSIGGDFGSAALMNLYYPQSNRGAGLVLSNVAVTTGERMLSTVVQEFVLNRLTAKRLRN